MTDKTVIDAIQKQIDAASPILEKIAFLAPKPARPVFGDTSSTLGRRPYDRKTVSKYEEEISRWQYTTKSVIAACFGADSEHYHAFEQTIVDNRGFYLDAKEDLEKEVSSGRSTLSAIIEAESLTSQVQNIKITSSIVEKKEAEAVENQTIKVFISHSSADKPVIDSFVDNVLVMGLGLSKNEIAYTSNEVYGVAPGDDISRYIKENIEAAEIVLLMISENYKQSEVCLNEMGAAWALGKPFVSVLLPETGYDKIGWLTNLQKAIKINHKGQIISLCQKIVGLIKNIKIQDRLTAIVSYTDKFIGSLPHTSIVPQAPKHSSIQTGNIDDLVKKAISELGEFTIKELQEATNIKNYRFLADKLNAMVAHGDLDAIGSNTHRKYRIKV